MEYIELSILTNMYIVPLETVKTGSKRYRQGKSKSWACIKDPKDLRKVLIDLDTIPEPTRKKYNIPTGEEYQKQQYKKSKQEQIEYQNQQYEKRKQERIEYETKILRERIELEEEQKRKAELEKNNDKYALINAYNKDWIQYVYLYLEHYGIHKRCNELAHQSAKEHAFWLEAIKISGGVYPDYGGNAVVFRLYSELLQELIFTEKSSNFSYFTRRMKLMRTLLKQGKSIVSVVANNRVGERDKHKYNDFHRSLIMHYVSHEKKYSYRLCTDLVNQHCINENQPTTTESYIKLLMQSDTEFKTLVYSRRNGAKYLNESVLPNAIRYPVDFPANLWMIDGTPIQFFCKDIRGRAIRLNLFVVLDAFSRKIVGFDIALSEDKFTIMNALKMAVQYEGHLPKEILSDNFSANKTEEIIAIKEQMIKLGVNWRLAKVGNPQDKTHVERFFGVFQSEECVLYDDYIGEGIQSRRDNRPNPEYLAKMTKNILTVEQMKVRMVTMIAKYNERAKRERKSPLELYKLPKPDAVEMNIVRTALLFWSRTKHTVKQGTVKITVNKTEHYFEIKSHRQKLQLQGKQVYVRYDECDLDRIMLFDIENENAICECRKSIRVYVESDKPKDGLIKHTAKVKSYKKFINKEIQEIYKKGFGDKEFIPIHPLDLEKNQINNKESLDFIETTLQRMDVRQGNEEPTRKPQKPILEGITINTIDELEKGTISKKKPQKERLLKVVQNQ